MKHPLLAILLIIVLLLGSAGFARSANSTVLGFGAEILESMRLKPSSPLTRPYGSEPVASATTRVSVGSGGTQANHNSSEPSISADGRYVAFESDATNLVSDDTNGMRDIFVHDRETATTIRVSVSSAGAQGNRASCNPSISADGRYVAFDSEATNLIVGDTTLSADVFVHDRQTGQTTLASMASDGTQANRESWHPSISAHGRFIAFESLATNLAEGGGNIVDVYIHNRETGETTIASVDSDGLRGDDSSYRPSISADGRYLAFYSYAGNLVSNDTNGMQDVFVHDRQTRETIIVSISSEGRQGDMPSWFPTISADGHYVAFESLASNLVSGDDNRKSDIFIRDRESGATFIASVASGGTQGNNSSYLPALSADGQFVAFHSWASNLAGNDNNGKSDVFVHDVKAGLTYSVSVANDGALANDHSRDATISANGRYVAFSSQASNLVAGDNNECCGFRDGHCADVFVRDRGVDNPVVLAARLDIGMPYSIYRGCPSPYAGCGGDYHGFDAGVCTDLVMDAFRGGAGLDVQEALSQDYPNFPGRYLYGTARSAEDMRRYFQTNQQLLSHQQTYNVGDIVFFDWDASGSSNHVGTITQVDLFGRPTRMVHAPGVHSGNPNGRAVEVLWKRTYDQHVQGHGRLAEMGAGLNALAESVQLLRVSVDSALVSVRLYDDDGRFTSSTVDENLIASNVEQFVPYIPGGQYADLGTGQVISVTQPRTNADQYTVELTGQAPVTYHLRIETLQGSSVTHTEVFTGTVSSGETHGTVIALTELGGSLALAAAPPGPTPHLGIPEALSLAGLSRAVAQKNIAIVETSGQLPLQNAVVTSTVLMNQLGGTVAASELSITPNAFSLAASGSQTVALQADLSGTEPGLYQGSLVIRSDNGATQMIPLTLDVQFRRIYLPVMAKRD